MTSKLPKSLERYANKIADYNDERADGNAIFIEYKPGWCSYTYAMGELHADSGYSVKEVAYYLGRAQRCTCKYCVDRLLVRR